MKRVYLERRYVNYTFESTELDLNDLDLFIRSELERYDIYESSTSSLRNSSITPHNQEKQTQSVNNLIEDTCPEDTSDNTKVDRYHSSFSSNTSVVTPTPPGGLSSYQQLATDQETWNTSLTSAPCSRMEQNSSSIKNSLSGATSQLSMASIKQSNIYSIFLTVVVKDLFIFRFNFRTKSIFLCILWML